MSFLSLCINRCTIYRRGYGGVIGATGEVNGIEVTEWIPVVAMAAIPCRIDERGKRITFSPEGMTSIETATVFFPISAPFIGVIDVQKGDQLRINDLTPHYIVEGRALRSDSIGPHHYEVTAVQDITT